MHLESFYKAMHSPNLDSSDFILITLQLLSNDKVDATKLAEIRRAYLKIDYSRAIHLIHGIIADLGLPSVSNQALVCKKNDHPLRNRSRRYFETIMSLDLWNDQGAKDLACYEKLGQLMASLNGNYTNGTTASNLKEAESIIAGVRQVGEETPSLMSLSSSLRALPTSISNLKDRGGKRNTTTYNIYSCHIGIIKSQDPVDFNMRKELKNKTQHNALIPYEVFSNKITDTFDIDYRIQGYSATHPAVPFVNSISGTTFNLISVLSVYIERYQGTENLEDDINRLIRGFIAFTCMNGYHSFREMVEVLRDQQVQQIFAAHQIKIHEDFVFPQQNLEKNIETASFYAKQLNLRENVNESIRCKHHHFFMTRDSASHLAERLNLKPFYKLGSETTLQLRKLLAELILAVPSETDRLKMKNKAHIDHIARDGSEIVVTIAGRYTLRLYKDHCKLSDKNFDRSIFPISSILIEQMKESFTQLSATEKEIKEIARATF